MKKLATAIAAVALIATPALAADMAVKAPPPVPAPATVSWTGWYAGLNFGVSWGGDPINLSTTNLQNCDPQGCQGAFASAMASAQGTTGVFSGNTSGFIGGGQLGYNWQFSNLVVASRLTFRVSATKLRSEEMRPSGLPLLF